MTDRKHLTFFESVCGADRVFSGEPMSRHTTFRVGGPADYFLVPGDPDQLKKLVRYCKDNGIAFFILGNGSNLLVSDEGYRGAVIQLFRNMSEIRIEGTRIYADAGALLSQIAAQAAAASLTGLEFAVGCLVNRTFGWRVWDYSARGGHVLGQICPMFSIVWFIISLSVIPLSFFLKTKLFADTTGAVKPLRVPWFFTPVFRRRKKRAK